MIQSFQKYLYPFLSLMGDGKVRDISQVSDDLGKTMNLTDEELAETYEISGQNRHRGRCGWARTWFLKAGVLESPKRGHFVISKSGKDLLESGVTEITQKFLIDHYPSFAAFAKTKKKDKHETNPDEPLDTSDPINQMEDAFAQLNNKLIDDLLQYISEQDPKFFEKLVVD